MSLPSHNKTLWHLEGAEAALWMAYQATGEDTSEGPYGDWHADAVQAVEALRAERDQLADALDTLIDRAEQVRVDLKGIL